MNFLILLTVSGFRFLSIQQLCFLSLLLPFGLQFSTRLAAVFAEKQRANSSCDDSYPIIQYPPEVKKLDKLFLEPLNLTGDQ